MSLTTKGKKRERKKTHWTVFNSICPSYIKRLYGRAIYVHIHRHTHYRHTHTHTHYNVCVHTYVRRPCTVNTFSLYSNRLIITHVRVTMGLYEIICVKFENCKAL